MYAYSNIFDDILHRTKSTKDLVEYENVQTMLREDIVNPLRRYEEVFGPYAQKS